MSAGVEKGDMIIRLYDLPPAPPEPEGVTIRRSLPPEHRIIADWITAQFSPAWAAEAQVAMSSHPISCYVAVRDNELLGFACADATAKGFFGPTGVAPSERGKGIGEALLFATLKGMREMGYAYAIIGSPGPVAFYRKRLDGWMIPGSSPGIYKGMLRPVGGDPRRDD